VSYKIKEIYYTIQGEGFHAGRPAVFCRFTGCNLWSGREEDRHKAICQFCDTDFVGTDGHFGGKYDADQLTNQIISFWPQSDSQVFCVFTGGEPLLQLDEDLIKMCHEKNIEVAVESNGTILPPPGIDWLCISPKAHSECIVTEADELKFVFPQNDIKPEEFEKMDFDHFFIQPMDGTEIDENILKAITFCKNNPMWKLSIQIHKYLQIP